MATQKDNFKKMRLGFFFALITALTFSMFVLIRPFFYAFFWALIIAMMLYPLFLKILRVTKMRTLSVVCTIVIVLCTIIVPVMVIGGLLVKESYDVYQTVSQLDFFSSGDVTRFQLADTFLEPYVMIVAREWKTYAGEAIQFLSTHLFSSIQHITSNTVSFVLNVFFMLYILFYFLSDGEVFLKRLSQLSPLPMHYEEKLFGQFRSTARATLKSSLIIGGIQGLIGGVLFFVTGINGALMWGILMMIVSLIPAVGSFIIWFPAGLFMLAIGNIWQGVTILIVGFCLIATIDNVLRPPLIGKDIEMHPLIVLFSTLGGLQLFGLSGFVMGPIIAALFLAVVQVYEEYFMEHLRGDETTSR